MEMLVAVVRHWWFGSWCALLPSPERNRLAHEHEIDAPVWSFELGLFQALAGGTAFLVGGLEFMRPASGDQSLLLLRNWFPGLSTTHFQGLGLINWFAWFLHPLSWPLAYAALVGTTRCIAFATTREAVAEPVVWLALRSWQKTRATVARRSFESRLGPWRPDRLETNPRDTREIAVVTCREKQAWSPVATVAIGERYYRLLGVERREDGEWLSLVYRLREQHPGGIIRRLVEYRPPSSP